MTLLLPLSCCAEAGFWDAAGDATGVVRVRASEGGGEAC